MNILERIKDTLKEFFTFITLWIIGVSVIIWAWLYDRYQEDPETFEKIVVVIGTVTALIFLV